MANLCGANEAIDNALSKVDDLIKEIDSKIDSAASEAAAALNNKLTELKSALDGLAIDLPSLPDVNLQAEITGAISDIDQTTIQGRIAFASKLAKLKLDFGDTVTELGLDLDKLIVSGTSLISGGGDICALIPNLDISAANSGTGVTTEEIVERSSTANLTLTQTPKEILSVQGKKTGTNFFSNINYKQTGLVIFPNELGNSEIKVTYLISLIKQKPVNSKQADTAEAKEKVSSVTTNLNSIFKKKEFSVNSLIGELTNLSSSSLPAAELKKLDIRSAITKAQSEISDPAYQSKVDAHVKKSYGELASFLQNPQKYKSVAVKTGNGEIVQTEVVTNTDSIIETTNETTGVKTVEKTAVAEKGFLNRPREISKKFQTKINGVGVVKDDPTGIIWKFEAVFGDGQVEIRRGIEPSIHEVKKIHGIEFDGSGNIKNEYFWYSDDGAKKELKFILNRAYEGEPAYGIVIQSNKNPPIPNPKEDYDGTGVEAIKMMNKHSNLIDVKIGKVSGLLMATWAPGFVPTGTQADFTIGPRGQSNYNEFSSLYGNNVPRVPQLPLPSIVSFKLDAIAMTYITLEKLNPK